MTQLTIRCFYSCALCGLKKVPVDVPARGDEDVCDWMEVTIRLVGQDHAFRAPGCHPKTLTDLMIPMTGTDRVGGPTLQ
jgi:hypothetical protein